MSVYELARYWLLKCNTVYFVKHYKGNGLQKFDWVGHNALKCDLSSHRVLIWPPLPNNSGNSTFYEINWGAKFRGNWWSGSDQTGAWYSLRKRLVFCPFVLRRLWSHLAKNFTGSLFFTFPILLPSLNLIRPVFKGIYPKMSSRLVTISAGSLLKVW